MATTSQPTSPPLSIGRPTRVSSLASSTPSEPAVPLSRKPSIFESPSFAVGVPPCDAFPESSCRANSAPAPGNRNVIPTIVPRHRTKWASDSSHESIHSAWTPRTSPGKASEPGEDADNESSEPSLASPHDACDAASALGKNVHRVDAVDEETFPDLIDLSSPPLAPTVVSVEDLFASAHDNVQITMRTSAPAERKTPISNDVHGRHPVIPAETLSAVVSGAGVGVDHVTLPHTDGPGEGATVTAQLDCPNDEHDKEQSDQRTKPTENIAVNRAEGGTNETESIEALLVNDSPPRQPAAAYGVTKLPFTIENCATGQSEDKDETYVHIPSGTWSPKDAGSRDDALQLGIAMAERAMAEADKYCKSKMWGFMYLDDGNENDQPCPWPEKAGPDEQDVDHIGSLYTKSLEDKLAEGAGNGEVSVDKEMAWITKPVTEEARSATQHSIAAKEDKRVVEQAPTHKQTTEEAVSENKSKEQRFTTRSHSKRAPFSRNQHDLIDLSSGSEEEADRPTISKCKGEKTTAARPQSCDMNAPDGGESANVEATREAQIQDDPCDRLFGGSRPDPTTAPPNGREPALECSSGSSISSINLNARNTTPEVHSAAASPIKSPPTAKSASTAAKQPEPSEAEALRESERRRNEANAYWNKATIESHARTAARLASRAGYPPSRGENRGFHRDGFASSRGQGRGSGAAHIVPGGRGATALRGARGAWSGFSVDQHGYFRGAGSGRGGGRARYSGYDGRSSRGPSLSLRGGASYHPVSGSGDHEEDDKLAKSTPYMVIPW